MEIIDRVGFFPGEPLPYGEWIALSRINVMNENPECRISVDVSYRDLLELIRAEGQALPAMVVPVTYDSFIISDGHRRRRVAAELGWPSLWCVCRNVDAAKAATIINSGVRPWRTQEVAQVIAHRPDIIGMVPRSKRGKLGLLIQILGDRYPQFVARYGVRAFDISRRVCAYLGWGEEGTREVLDYLLMMPTGVVRRLEEAMRDGITPDRLAAAIRGRVELVPRW